MKPTHNRRSSVAISILAMLATLAIVSTSLAASSANYAINWSQQGAGGGEGDSSVNYRFSSTIGQGIAGNGTSSNYHAALGYRQPFATDTPTPTPVAPTNTPLPTNTPVPPTNTPLPTNTPVPPTNTPLPTDTRVPTNTPVLPTNTPVPPTNTPVPTDTRVPTNTPVPPTNTPVPPTQTPGGPTATPPPTATPIPTSTPLPPTSTSLPTDTPLPTQTPGGPTATPPPTDTPMATNTPMPTDTPVAPTATAQPTSTPGGPTPTDCPNPFVDTLGDIFYPAIHYLYCRGVVNGTDGTHFSPHGTSTRAQFAKVVVLGFGLSLYTPTTGPDFTDVPSSYFAYTFIETGFHDGVLSGFDQASCAAHGQTYPCYLPNIAITRAQLTKLVVNAAGYPAYTPTGGTQDFSDVPPSNVFFVSIETAYHKGIINGYPGGIFLPNQNIERDQMCQIVYKGVTTP